MVIDVDVYVLDNKLKESIDYVQGTNALGISFHFLDYDIPSGASAKVYAAKPSTKAVYNTAVISGNDVNVDVTNQMFSEIGLTKLQVQIVKGADTLVTFVQPVRVHKNYVAGDVPESDNESNFIDEYLDDIKDATSKANTATNKANTAAGRAEDALEAIEGAVKGTLINDETPSKVTVYSGDKVEHLANLLDFSVGFKGSNASYTVDGNKATVKTTTAGAMNFIYRDFNLEAGRHTIAWNSTRTGKAGGGIYVQAIHSDGTTEGLSTGLSSTMNSYAVFEVKKASDVTRILFYSGVTDSAVGDTATFEAMLVKGAYDFSQERPMLNSVKDVTGLLLDERTNSVNLIRLDGIVPVRSEVSLKDNTLIVKATAVNKIPYAYVEYILKPGWYTISWLSTRNGKYGGGAQIEFFDDSGSTYITEYRHELNGTFEFEYKKEHKKIRIGFTCGNNSGTVIGDTATFEDVLLIEGTQYAPANLHNVKDLAQLTAAVDNRTAINLFGEISLNKNLVDITYIDNGFKITTTGSATAPNARKDFRDLKPNTNYVVVSKSQRTGEHGGGIHVGGIDGNVFTSLCDVTNEINPVAKFNTGDHEFIRIAFYSGLKGDPIGDSSTFTDIMLVEGDFAPGSYVPSIGADNFSQVIADAKATLADTGTELTKAQEDITEIQAKISDYKILWEGELHMKANQQCNLSEKISAQKNGVVLWFCVWNPDETSHETGWFPYYVHKSVFEVKKNAGVSNAAGFCVPIVTGGSFGTIGTKYIYVYDDNIKGNDVNNESGTGSNVKYDNGHWALRAVVGW